VKLFLHSTVTYCGELLAVYFSTENTSQPTSQVNILLTVTLIIPINKLESAVGCLIFPQRARCCKSSFMCSSCEKPTHDRCFS